MADAVELRPIGRVRRGGTEDVSEVEVDDEFTAGLDGIEKLEHLWVLYWMHELDLSDRQTLRAHPMGDPTSPKRGVFALHSPMRPNPIGMTRVRLVERRGTLLVVEGLDARDGSPVLDIKSA